MLDTLKTFLADFSAGTKKADLFEKNDYRLAAAALLVHIMTIDGQPDAAEAVKLRALLQQHYALDDEATDHLIEAAKAADREAVDLYHFTSSLNRTLDEKGRLRMVEMMWEIVYADGRRTEFEDNVVWRVADLLGVSSEERIALRQRVADQLAQSAPNDSVHDG